MSMANCSTPNRSGRSRRRELFAALEGVGAGTQRARAVLFDLDGTLIETDDVAVAAVAARLRFLGRLATEEQRLHRARRSAMGSEEIVNGVHHVS